MLLELILWAVMLGDTVVKYGNQPLDWDMVGIESTRSVEIVHSWFWEQDDRQSMVQRAYELWGIDFVLMLECENWSWDPGAKWDGGRSHGLCQMNTRWHKLPQEYYDSWEFQLEYCYQKWIGGTKFFGPWRLINGVKCSQYVKNRFIIND